MLQRRILFLKSFPGHLGRPGLLGGSAPRSAADGRGSGRPTSLLERIQQQLQNPGQRAAPIDMGRTPAVLRMLGLPNAPLHMPASVLTKIATGKRGERPPLSPEQIAKLPELIDDPVAVFASATVEGAVVVLTSMKDTAGSPVLAAIATGSRAGAAASVTVNVLASAYGKNSAERWTAEQADAGRLLYSKNAPSGAFHSGASASLQLRGDADASVEAAPPNIRTPDDLRKYREAQRAALLAGRRG